MHGGGRAVANGDGGLRHGTATETPTSRGVKFLDRSAMTPLLHGTRRLLHDELFYDFEDGAQGWVVGVESGTVCGSPVTALKHWELASGLPGMALGGTWWTNPNNGILVPTVPTSHLHPSPQDAPIRAFRLTPTLRMNPAIPQIGMLSMFNSQSMVDLIRTFMDILTNFTIPVTRRFGLLPSP